MKKIGFDFDKVFVEYPPFIPDELIERLYKKKGQKLSYRIPGFWEQKLRILSHHPLLRQPIKKHLVTLEALKKTHAFKLYLISSRFGFLKKRTNEWLAENLMSHYFDGLYFNYDNNQPHEFKNDVIQKLGINYYIDDDLDSLEYLAQKNPSISFYWLSYKKKYLQNRKIKNIIPIQSLQEFTDNYL